jgi:hypothetical protein
MAGCGLKTSSKEGKRRIFDIKLRGRNSHGI